MASATNLVGKPRLERSHQNLRWTKLLNCDMGQLIPVQCDLILPGDVFRLSHDIVSRLQPLVAPILNEINIDTHTFFVPTRIVDEDWEETSSGGEDGETTKIFPRWQPSDTSKYSLWDYFGHPINVNLAPPYPTDWHKRAYNMIWNEYYRDENLQDEIDINTSEVILYRAFKKDYFTSALKETQKGLAPSLPITGSATTEFEALLPLYQQVKEYIDSQTGVTGFNLPNGSVTPFDINRAGNNASGQTYPQTFSNSQWFSFFGNASSGVANNTTPNNFWSEPNVSSATFGSPSAAIHSHLVAEIDETFRSWLNNNTINLDNLATFDVNDLRAVIALQKFKERNARVGIRYTEQLQGRWRTSPRDDRLQRPEFIGGTRSSIIISEVLQTSQTTETTSTQDGSPQGNLAGHGLAANIGRIRKYRAQEWGWLITILSVMPKIGYSQGIDRQFLYESRYDLPAPEFCHLGEREIMNTEIYTSNDETQNRGIFGFRPMFDEHRLKQSMVCGDMRDVYNYWHLYREFDTLPLLNGDFITTKNNIRKDIFAVQDEPGFIIHCGNKLSITRSIPALGEPGLMDHF